MGPKGPFLVFEAAAANSTSIKAVEAAQPAVQPRAHNPYRNFLPACSAPHLPELLPESLLQLLRQQRLRLRPLPPLTSIISSIFSTRKTSSKSARRKSRRGWIRAHQRRTETLRSTHGEPTIREMGHSSSGHQVTSCTKMATKALKSSPA